MNLQRINHQGGKNLKYASTFAQILQIEEIAIIFNIELHDGHHAMMTEKKDEHHTYHGGASTAYLLTSV